MTVVVLLAALVSLLHGRPAQAAPDDVGYRDFSYGTAVAPTGEKPQSKLWYTPDGVWWGSLYNPVRQRFEIHQFMRDTQSWTSTGVQVDDRIDSQADALFEAARGRLFIVSHLRDTASSAGDRSLRFLSYTYAGGSFVPDPGFPVTIAMVNPEAAVLDEDSTGTLWVTWTEPNGAGGRKVRVAHSTTDPGHWSPPSDLSTDNAANLDNDDISALVSYHQRIGIMWSNQANGTLNFASHKDKDPDTAWDLTVLCDSATFGTTKCPDDHLNLKSLDADSTGRVLALVKTSLDDLANADLAAPLEILWTYNPAAPTANGWSRATVWRVRDNVTRAILLLDTTNRRVYTFATGPCCLRRTVYMKSSDNVGPPTFADGLGDAFIRLATDASLNNVTSTKQSVNATSGLLVLAGDDETRYYAHNYLPLTAGAASPPVIRPPDGDGDGVPDAQDLCPAVAGPASSGGCPPAAAAPPQPAPAAQAPPAPVPAVVVRVRSSHRGTRLHVNVDPNKGKGSWTFRVQKQRLDGSWRSLQRYRTHGAKETRTLNLRKGTYRVVVAPKYGLLGATSSAVRLRR